MSEARSSMLDSDAARRENALVGYQVAISLWAAHGEQGWARFNVMLVMNSVILGVIGLAITSPRPLPVFTLFLPIVGLFFCVIWLIFVHREAEYGHYYILSARELEEKYLFEPVQIVSRGGHFRDGIPVSIEIGCKPVQLRMSRVARALKARTAASWTVVILAILYIAIILQSVFQ